MTEDISKKIQDFKKFIQKRYSKENSLLINSAIEKYKKHIEKKDSLVIPISIFSKKLNQFETVVKYLTENLNLSYSKIGRILKKDRQVIWTTYKRSSKKYPAKFTKLSSETQIPISALASKRFSMSELIVDYLKNLNMKDTEIATLLHRNPKTIWTLHSRYKKKKNDK